MGESAHSQVRGVPGEAMLAHEVEQGGRHLALRAELLDQPDEGQAGAALRLGVQPAADPLEALDLGVARQVGTRTFGEGFPRRRHRTLRAERRCARTSPA